MFKILFSDRRLIRRLITRLETARLLLLLSIILNILLPLYDYYKGERVNWDKHIFYFALFLSLFLIVEFALREIKKKEERMSFTKKRRRDKTS